MSNSIAVPATLAVASFDAPTPSVAAVKPATVRSTRPEDLAAVTQLHDEVFGPGAYPRAAYRVREAAPPLSRHCLISLVEGELVAAIRFTRITIGGTREALLLGPLAVRSAHAGKGYGKELVAVGLERARAAGVRLVLLVGNSSYYARFGFRPVPPGRIRMPGPVDYTRLLAVELQPTALEAFQGVVTADDAT